MATSNVEILTQSIVVWDLMAVSACKNVAAIFDCSCCNGQSTCMSAKLAKEIAGAEETDNIICYNVDNKYYSAVIHLCWGNVSAEEAGAVLVITDINQEASFSEAKKKWIQLESITSAEILILVCYSDLPTSSSLEPTELPQYQAALQWCVTHGFELIWWQPGRQVKEEDTQEAGLLHEQTDVDRIREALQAHTWPKMIMKHDKNIVASSDQANSASSKVKNKDEKESVKDKKYLDAQSHEMIDKMLGKPPNEDEDDFQELFDKFMAMKETAQSLPHEQRKAYAEKVVMDFWQAIGGDEEEVRSSDENSD